MQTRKPFLTIGIPSYNRPFELERLLQSIPEDCGNQINITIAEDCSPRRSEVRKAVDCFRSRSALTVIYVENERNLGYDANVRQLAQIALGEYIMYMGDDDEVIGPEFKKFLWFLSENRDLGYVLRAHEFVHSSGAVEMFKYYPTGCRFAPGERAVYELFRKSVFISGFCIRRETVAERHTNQFDGTLLYQLYMLAETVLHLPSAYYDTPFVRSSENMRALPMFGNACTEKALYTPGEITVRNSINFINGFFKIAQHIDTVHKIRLSDYLAEEFSRYAYPLLALQRWRGRRHFKRYVSDLLSETPVRDGLLFRCYYWALYATNKRFCDDCIILIKRLLGRTPRL